MRSITDELAYSVIIAVGLHVLWLYGASWFGNHVDERTLLTLLTGNFGKDNEFFAETARIVGDSKGRIAGYFMSLYGGSAILGGTGHWVVRKLRLDHDAAVLRFENRWYYLLTGEVLGFADQEERDESGKLPDGVFASAVIEQGKDCFLYWGLVKDFSFDENGALDRIVLSLAYRRPFERDRSSPRDPDAAIDDPLEDNRFYEIHGDFLVIQYAAIKTLNLDYFWIEEDKAEEPQEPNEQIQIVGWKRYLPLRI
jgi:hypothetical protein